MIDIIYFFFRSQCTFADTMAKPFLLYNVKILKDGNILEFLNTDVTNQGAKNDNFVKDDVEMDIDYEDDFGNDAFEEEDI